MLIEVTGASTRNKGAELMMATVRAHFGVPHSDTTLAVTPWFGCLQDRLRYNLANKLEWKKWGRTRLALACTPARFRKSMGLYEDEDLDAVIDISGFAFGDQHPVVRTTEFASRVETWAGLGKRVVLLPQAFGPFEGAEMRDAFARVVDKSHLIYARDTVSLGHIEKHFGKRDHVKLAPDITIGFSASVASDTPPKDVLIVPNMRMMDRSKPSEAGRYVPLLQTCIRAALSASHPVKILLHDANEDKKLVPEIQAGLDKPVEVISDPDPVSLKQRISQAKLVIGSRFHGVVASLSSGVPVLSTGWSHKYEMLLDDFGCPNSILYLDSEESVLRDQVLRQLEDDFQVTARNALVEAKKALLAKCHEMWDEVDALLGWSAGA